MNVKQDLAVFACFQTSQEIRAADFFMVLAVPRFAEKTELLGALLRRSKVKRRPRRVRMLWFGKRLVTNSMILS